MNKTSQPSKNCEHCGEALPLLRHYRVYLCAGCKANLGWRKYNVGRPAHQMVSLAIRLGFLPPIAQCVCVDCGAPAKHYDHRDYSKPLDVEPVCHACNVRRGPAISFASEVAEQAPA